MQFHTILGGGKQIIWIQALQSLGVNAGDFPLVHSGHAISTVYDMEMPGSQPNAHDRFRVKGASCRGLTAALCFLDP